MTEFKSLPKPRRFYQAVEVAPATAGGFAILLDGRGARTPGTRPLVLPTKTLAALIQQEWAAQGDVLDWGHMPATRLAGLTIDGDDGARGRAVKSVVDYASSDLICFFAPAPRSLVARQEEVWGPLHTWAQEVHSLSLLRATGVMPQVQPEDTLERLAQIVASMDDFTLSGLALAAPLFGSAVIALALAHQKLDAPAALEAARVDEIFQEAQWGVDEENARRVRAMAKEAEWLGRWFAALP
jgi:chaperone required for assembly of F1-ATPase